MASERSARILFSGFLLQLCSILPLRYDKTAPLDLALQC